MNADCELKICDFGQARGLNQITKKNSLSEYAAMRWYRAPEIMLSFAHYVRHRNLNPVLLRGVWLISPVVSRFLVQIEHADRYVVCWLYFGGVIGREANL